MTIEPNDRWRFRRARLRDSKQVVDLVRDLAGEMTESEARLRFRRLVLRPSYLVYVLEHDDAVVGLWYGREGYFLGSSRPFLQGMGAVIREDYRGRGVGSEMLATHLARVYRETDYVQRWAVTQHEHLRDFYLRLGYESTGTRYVLHEQGQGRPSFMRRLARKLGV